MKDIDINELIQSFGKKLRQTENERIGMTIGVGPEYPMVIVYLGEQSAKHHDKIGEMLFRIWPPYKREICFFEIKEDMTLFREENTISEEQFQREISELFAIHTHFRTRSHLMVYFVLDTTQISKKEDLEQWIDIVVKLKEKLAIYNVMSMLFMLLNEDFMHKSESKMIRNVIVDNQDFVNSIFLVSNQRSDRVIVNDWYLCCKIVSDVMILSNSNDMQKTTQLFHSGIKTAGYALDEKPVEAIAQVVITSIIQEINRRRKKIVGKVDEMELDSKLGITKNGTIDILDQYEEKELSKLLPDVELLNQFPRSTSEEICIEDLTEKEFNEITMDSWECYLSEIIKQVETNISDGKALKEQWKLQYKKLLSNSFSADELVWLMENDVMVKSRFKKTMVPSSNDKILKVANNRLKYKLSTNETLVSFFTKCLEDEAMSRKEFLRTWKSVVESLNEFFGINDEKLRNFYERIVKSFFDRNGDEILRLFNEISNVEELKSFLIEMVNKCIQSEPIFSEPFERELQERLDAVSDPVDAKSYIRNKLTGDEVKMYLTVNGVLDSRIMTVILVTFHTELYKSLKNNLPDQISYYNTNCSDGAEALYIYHVEDYRLIS